jgi:putative ABC transport system ATP-binding protein
MPALMMDEVRKVYGSGEQAVVALDGVSLEVGDDELLALVGPSGSGKTTLLSIAGGLLRPTDGAVQVGPHRIESYGPRELTRFRRTAVGFVFQGVNLVPFLTARENLLVAAEIAGVERRRARARAEQLLGELGLAGKEDRLPARLSGGERQRVAIGRALMNEPALVLFDEPTSSLDSRLGAQVMELIRAEVKGRGTAAVVVTHDLPMTRYADRAVEIHDGRLVT